MISFTNVINYVNIDHRSSALFLADVLLPSVVCVFFFWLFLFLLCVCVCVWESFNVCKLSCVYTYTRAKYRALNIKSNQITDYLFVVVFMTNKRIKYDIAHFVSFCFFWVFFSIIFAFASKLISFFFRFRSFCTLNHFGVMCDAAKTTRQTLWICHLISLLHWSISLN